MQLLEMMHVNHAIMQAEVPWLPTQLAFVSSCMQIDGMVAYELESLLMCPRSCRK